MKGISGWLVAMSTGVCALFAFATATPSALALPPGRHYELVSPPYKNGYGVNGGNGITAVAPDGESVAFFSQGAFAETPGKSVFAIYLARRGSKEWGTTPVTPPASVTPMANEPEDFSPSLGSGLWTGCPGPDVYRVEYECSEYTYLMHPSTAPSDLVEWGVAGFPLKTISGMPFSPAYEGVSADFCHVFFAQGAVEGFTSEGGPLLPEAQGTEGSLYDLKRGCGAETGLSLVGVKNKDGSHGEPEVIDPGCVETLGGFGNAEGSGRADDGSKFNAAVDNGERVFFTDFTNPVDGKQHCGSAITMSSANPPEVFARLGGTRTVEVSRPLDPGPYGGCGEGGAAGETPGEVPCADADMHPASLFWGASEDGSKVFFTSAGALLPGVSDASQNLFMATIGCPNQASGCTVGEDRVTSLVRASIPVSGEAAGVQGVTQVALDGSRVYFVARGVLSAASGPEGLLPLEGADNLYVYDSATEEVSFIADLCSDPGESGVVADHRCPSNVQAVGERDDLRLWHQEQDNKLDSETAGPAGDEGRFLVFSSVGQLVKSDTDNARDVYRYDARTGVLDRISSGEDGADANGSGEDVGASESEDAAVVTVPGIAENSLFVQRHMNNRGISDDGSRIVFTSAAPLSAKAKNGVADVYEWHLGEGEAGEGSVSLVSSGLSPTPDGDPVISPSGEDIFFVSSQGMVARDTDGQADVYDARMGPGFAPEAAEALSCSGSDACLGPLSPPAPLLVPGTLAQAPEGDLPAPAVAATKPKTATKARKAKAKKKKRKAKRKKAKARGRAVKAGRTSDARTVVASGGASGAGR